MSRATIDFVAPFFIARDVERSLDFYRDKLGFTVVFQETEPPHQTPFFAIVNRDGAMLFLKGSGEAVPNAKRYAWARFDAYFSGTCCSLGGRGNNRPWIRGNNSTAAQFSVAGASACTLNIRSAQ